MRKILIAVLLLAISLAAFSQRRRAVRRSYARSSQWHIMPKAGFNIATITNWGDDARLGLALGAELGCRVSDVVTLSGSLIYSQQGTSTWYYSRDYDARVRLDYLNLPFMVHFNVIPSLQLKVGLQPGILVNDRLLLRARGQDYEGDLRYTLSFFESNDPNTEGVDWSIPFAIAYEHRNWVFDARYNMGLNNVTSHTWWGQGHNSVFQFTVGYKFGL